MKGKTCLDIGCGDASLLFEMKKRGASKVVGIEPSKRNVSLARLNYPDLEITITTLQDCIFKIQFDVITCVMVLVHIPDINFAFKKIKSLLKRGGRFFLIVEDFDYYKKPRHGYEFKIKFISRDQAVIAVKRRYGLVADVIRRIGIHKKAAKDAGLKLEKHFKMKFTKEFLKASPRYKTAKGKTINHLLIFTK